MENCDRCGNSFSSEKLLTARRKDGSNARICQDCAAELKAKNNPKPQAKTAVQPMMKPLPAKKAAKKQEDPDDFKWYVHIIFGVVFIGFMIIIFNALYDLEQGTTDSLEIWWPIALAYNILGLWGAVAIPALLALLSFVVGIKKFLAEENE